MAFPSVTYTFSNSTTADATQVNQNYTDLINGASDGTKSFNISAITAGGTATLNGSCVLGASSANSLTINASLASTISILTTYTYDIGSDAFGLRSLYLGSNSSAHSTRLLGANVSSAWTLTFPTAAPATINSFLTSDASGVTSWTPATVLPGYTATKTGTYGALSSDDFIPCDATSAGFTVTLPAANAYKGKVLQLCKIDSSANQVTISRAGSDTLNGGTSTTLSTQYEVVSLISDGSSAWYVVQREYPKTWTTYSLSITAVTSNPSKGTVSLDEAKWRRIGSNMEIHYTFRQTAGGSAGTGAYLFSIPTGYTFASTFTGASSGGSGANGSYLVGDATAYNGTVNSIGYVVPNTDTNTLSIFVGDETNDPQVIQSAFQNLGNTTQRYSFLASLPITGWA